MSHSHTIYSLSVNSIELLASGAGDGNISFWNLGEILKTFSGGDVSSKPLQSYTTKCMNILNCSYSNDNLLYAIGS